MGLMSPGMERLLDIPEFQQVLSSYDGDSGTRSGGRRKGQSPCELLEGLSLFLSHRCQGLRPCVVPIIRQQAFCLELERK